MKEGLFIVIYGVNNLGKSTQAAKLVEAMEKSGLQAEYLKYPIYDLTPTGPKINEILRSGQNQSISEEEFQEIYAKNRTDFQPQLCKKLHEGINVVAEDYAGTGIAWGLSKGAGLEKLLEMNRGLVKPDIEILLDGERFLIAKEKNHQHESNDELADDCRRRHLELAARFGWEVVNANQEAADVHQEILAIIEKKVKELNNELI
jgi:dTMP kinase